MRCLMKHVHFGNVTLTNKAVADHELRVHFQAAVYAYRRRRIKGENQQEKRSSNNLLIHAEVYL